MQAFILAGGKGVRLQPYTLVFPKPMLPVGGVPIIDIIVRQLSYYGFRDITISLGYLGEYIKLYFNDKSKIPSGTAIHYVEEKEALGTAGSLSLFNATGDDFLVLNGDLLTSIDFNDFFRFHKDKSSSLSIAVGTKQITMSLGIVDMQGDLITNFKEKPTVTYHDSMGIYIYNKRILSYIEKNKRLDFNDLVLQLLKTEERVCGYRSEKPYYWIDIGQHADYSKANEEIEKHWNEFVKG